MINLKSLFLLLLLIPNQSIAQVFFEGFENWNDTSGIEYPLEWEVYKEIDTIYANLIKASALSEGSHAVKISSTVPGFEGMDPTYIRRGLPFRSSLISLEFSYKCEGEGKCTVRLVQGSNGDPGGNFRVIWTQNSDENPDIKKCFIDSISINEPFDYFFKIEFLTSPAGNGAISWGTSEFTVDSVVIINLDPNRIILAEKPIPNIILYPNPTQSDIWISSPSEILSVKVLNSRGQEINYFNNPKLKIPLPEGKGTYFLVITTEQNEVYSYQVYKKD